MKHKIDSDFITDEINKTFKLRCKNFRMFFFNNFNFIDTLNEYF